MAKLEINREYTKETEASAVKRDTEKQQELISSIDKEIAAIEKERTDALHDLAAEPNYDVFFYTGGALVMLNILFNFNLPGLVIAGVFGGLYYVYHKYLNKEKRSAAINVEFDGKIKMLRRAAREREEKLN